MAASSPPVAIEYKVRVSEMMRASGKQQAGVVDKKVRVAKLVRVTLK